MPTIAVVGAGPGLGLSVALVFGAQDFDVGLVARNQAKLAQLVAALGEKGVCAAHVAINPWIGSGAPQAEPAAIAQTYWDLFTTRTETERVNSAHGELTLQAVPWSISMRVRRRDGGDAMVQRREGTRHPATRMDTSSQGAPQVRSATGWNGSRSPERGCPGRLTKVDLDVGIRAGRIDRGS